MTKSQLIEVFLGFLHQLLHHNTDSWWRGRRHVKILETELRFLHTIFEDISSMLLDWNDHQYEAQFQDLMEEFEAVANQAGCFIHSMLFSTHLGFRETEELAAAIHGVDCLKATLKSSDIITTPPCTTPRTSTVNSVIFFVSLVNDVQDLLQGEDDRIINTDVKDQINLLYQGLIFLHSSINDMRSPQFYEIVQRVTHNIGNIAHQAQYLISTFLVKDAPLWYVVIRLTYLNQRIHLTKNELQVIKEKYKVRGLKMKRQLSLPHEITKNNSNDTMNGFENETMSILDHLVGGRKSRQVISIYGMPGLGKTTLAKKLYNHPFVREKFDKLSWFLVSQTYRIQSILIDILIHINNDLGEDRILNMEEETLVEHIYKTLKGRRYLVVMDDLWDSTLWDELQRCLPDDGNGSRVLLTSRNKGVAPPNSIIHELPFLSVEQCWELLQKKVFFHNRNCPPQLQMIGKTIAAKCRGLPLTVCVIAGVLSSMDEDESVWEKVGESLASYVKYGAYNIVMQILELSYYHLPNHLKSCFLSFRSYKEDEEISVEKLKRFWIAKGFIRKENERSMENVAEEYIMELIDRSLVMVAKRRLDGRGVKACVVHGLLRDFCLKISQGEGFWQYWSDELTSRFRFGVYVEALERKCATLWLSQHEHSFSSDGQASSYVRDMRSLRVLYFYDSDNCDCRCYILRVEYLINLRQSRAEYSEDWNSGCTSSNKLEYLSGLVIKKSKDEELLRCSSHLRKLKCTYDLVSSDLDEREYLHFDLGFLTRLHSLSLTFLQTYRGFELQEFRFPRNIRKLKLGWLRMRWEKMQSVVGRLEHLELLKLCDAFVGDVWDTRNGEFQKLRFLELEYMSLCEWNVSSSEHFPKLQHLVLRHCQDLKEIPSEMGVIATLDRIEVRGKCLDSLRESVERIKEEQVDMGNEQLNVIVDATELLRILVQLWRKVYS